jgi:hypothetical protein
MIGRALQRRADDLNARGVQRQSVLAYRGQDDQQTKRRAA